MRTCFPAAFQTVQGALSSSPLVAISLKNMFKCRLGIQQHRFTTRQEDNMLNKLAIGLALGVMASAASAQSVTNIQANPTSSAYLQDGRGVITRSGTGLCWRSGFWTPADAVAGCDGELAPPITKATAPAIAPVAEKTAPPTVAASIQSPAPIKRCDFAVTLENDQTFAFGMSVLTSAAKKRIDEAVLGKLATCSTIDIIIVTGHTDRLGAQQYNQKLSDQRAKAVAGYLKNKGVSAQLDTLGMGKTQSIKSCGDIPDHKKLVECLAPNRRVVVEVKGLAKSN